MRYICSRCSNTDKNYFFFINGRLCCRKCINFIGDSVKDNYQINQGDYSLQYTLTRFQREASDFILTNIVNGCDCAINAVCGAGKTEIIYDVLKYCLNNNLKVGIAIPRKDVVVELQERIAKDFNVSVIAVYGGNHLKIEGDIIIFTTHQAFRYVNYFDILIIDEVDAFPYANNDVLKGVISKCSKRYIYLSATMPEYIEKNKIVNKFYLNRRYHNYDLPIPKCKEAFFMVNKLKQILKKHKDKVILVYFPTIKIQNKIARKIKSDYSINSKTSNREEVLLKIKQMVRGVVFTTTILERGITIKNVQVIVFNADHPLFNKDTLIQISGRVGRHKDYPSGNIFFICKIKNKNIIDAIRTLKRYNE